MIPLLIVDDESIIRETIAAMLRRKYPDQFHIFLASNGQEALSLVASENVELVLADIKMPVMNGLELLHRLHEQQLQCDVIFISGFDDYSFVREAMKSGAVDYLLKPIAENELYAQIDSFLKRAALRVPIHTARIRPEENVYLQQYVLDKLFDSNGIVPDGVLAELHLTPSSPAALLAAPAVSSEADLQQFKASMAKQPLLIGSEEKGREMIIHSREMKKAQHTIFSTLAEADLAPVKVALMEPSLESLFLEVIK